MPKVKVPRKNISLDMTAMCDMAFLLLTFFMLTTKFKAQEPVSVDMPSSISEMILPDADVLMISVDKSGKVFYNVDGQSTRQQVLGRMGQKYKVSFTQTEGVKFALMSSIGTPVAALKPFINASNEDRNQMIQPGIPIDSTNNQLRDWVLETKKVSPNIMVAVKGDREVNYQTVEKVIATLQDININKIKLITTMESKPQ